MRVWQVLCFLFLLMGLVSAEDITLNTPANGDSCVLGEYANFSYTPNVAVSSCYLYTNTSGALALTASNTSAVSGQENFFYNIPMSANNIRWYVRCVNSSLSNIYSENYTFVLKDVLYCAVLSETACPLNPNVNSDATLKTRLGNTRGFWLENQDCNVFITDSAGRIVKSFDSMLYMQTVSIQMDKDGNLINVADKKVPLTDSAGYYVFPFHVDSSWAWVGDEFTANIVCNGETTQCSFNVTKDRLPDMNNYQQLGMDASGIIIFVLILLYLVYNYAGDVKRRIWK
jgi:hypothetical protein